MDTGHIITASLFLYWNVAIVHEDQKDEGVVLHELAHILGQERDFYKSHERCRQFRGNTFEACEKYKIPIALEADDQSWRFIGNKFSIVNNEQGIKNLWMDRDTYQKTFTVLSRRAVIPSDEELFGDSIVVSDYRREEKSFLKAVVSGFYYEQEEAFIVPRMRIEKTKLLTPSFFPKTENIELPVLTFQLKEGESLLQQIKRPILKMDIKTVYETNTSKTELFDISPTMAVFKLPEDSQRDLWIFVLNPKGHVIYSAPVPKPEKTMEL